MTTFQAAPWSLSLKLISAVSAAILLGVGIWAIHMHLTEPAGPASALILLGCVAWGILLVSALYIVRSYTLDGQQLQVQRLLWSTTIDLQDLIGTSDGTKLYPGSLRVFGNAGVFSFSGLFYYRGVGTYRAFVTNWRRAVIVQRTRRPIVISPADPKAMVSALQTAFPQISAGNVSEAL